MTSLHMTELASWIWFISIRTPWHETSHSFKRSNPIKWNNTPMIGSSILNCFIRNHELQIRRANFTKNEYMQARKNFVHKKNPTTTPLHLTLDQYRPQILDTKKDVGPACTKSFSKAFKMNGSKVANRTLEASNQE